MSLTLRPEPSLLFFLTSCSLSGSKSLAGSYLSVRWYSHTRSLGISPNGPPWDTTQSPSPLPSFRSPSPINSFVILSLMLWSFCLGTVLCSSLWSIPASASHASLSFHSTSHTFPRHTLLLPFPSCIPLLTFFPLCPSSHSPRLQLYSLSHFPPSF